MRLSSVLPTVSAILRHGGNPGRCDVCEGPTLFVRTGPWDRDEYRCVRCRSIPRFRAMALVLQRERPDWRSLALHESSPDGSLSRKFAKQAPGYSSSQYLPGKELGTFHDGIRNEDLRSLTFRDASFDIFVTQDVLEHVPEPDRAFAEIGRVLKPGGIHVFTVPCHDSPTRERARIAADGSLELLLEPEYHGNPVDAKGSLVVTDWGPDILDRIRQASGMDTERFDFRDPRRGLAGAFLSVFVSRKHA